MLMKRNSSMEKQKNTKEFEEKLKELSLVKKRTYFTNSNKKWKGKESYINQSPTSDEVQQLIVEWKSYLEQSIVCDSEMLTCIANTYKLIIDLKII